MLSLAEKLAILEMDREYNILRRGDGYAFGEAAVLERDVDEPQEYRPPQKRQSKYINKSNKKK